MAVLHFSSLEELVYQLSPSEWSKRGMTGEEVIKDHCAVTKAGMFMSFYIALISQRRPI